MAETTIRWSQVKARLEELLSQVRASMDDAHADELYRLQGEARAYKKLMNLPEALALIQNEDERAEAERLERLKK